MSGGLRVRLVVMVPAFNEAQDIARTLAAVPRSLAGFDEVRTLVIDDGSQDGTSALAEQAGADAIVRHAKNRGLAAAFRTGLDAALAAEADVIVNLDADGQYDAKEIPALVAPILEGTADIVVGTRPIEEMRHFSWPKRRAQRIGSWIVRLVSGLEVEDATSGFRAFSDYAARRIGVYSPHTYTLETLIQAGSTGLTVATVPISANGPTRPSRLMRSWPQYVRRSAVTIVRVFVVYRPFRFFAALSVLFGAVGAALIVRFLVHYLIAGGEGRVQSLVIGGALLTIGVQMLVTAFLADAVATNRRILEEIRYRLREPLREGPGGR